MSSTAIGTKNTFDEFVRTIQVRAWKSLHGLLIQEFSGANWAFRGQRLARWGLTSNLERLAASSSLRDYERYVLEAMKRRAHHYIDGVPAEHDTAEWLALAQHHGAPTRLMDWTRSPYVALYFAIEQVDRKENAALWAIDYRLCKRYALDAAMRYAGDNTLFNEDDSFGSPELFNRFFVDQPARLVAPFQPRRLNERITVQQGLFFSAGDITVSFEANLQTLLAFVVNEYSGLPTDYRSVAKIEIPGVLRPEILRELNRMNINAATLFPGIDGFARSVAMNVGLWRDTDPGTIFAEGYHDDQT